MTTHFRNITLAEAQELFTHDMHGDASHTSYPNTVTIDIRDQASYISEHIEGAVHITDKNIDQFVQTTDFDLPILIYCYHGHSSQHAAEFLVNQGFETVYSLIGGYTAWAAAQ
jgi:thiosulfate sulfurtransferase